MLKVKLPQTKPLLKPRLRGYIHQEAFYVALGASVLLIARSAPGAARWASAIYALGLLLLFGISALYHRPTWSPEKRAFMKRLDHSAIFVLIAGTATPVCLLALEPSIGHRMLYVIWGSALAGIAQSIFWISAPKWLTSIFYVAIGWTLVPYVPELIVTLGTLRVVLIVIGGCAYTIGAVLYALKWPRLSPTIFGYHELFHALTIVGASLHFFVVYHLIAV